MRKIKKVIVFVFCFISSQIVLGKDADNALEQINNSIAFGVSVFNIDYKEIFFELDNIALNKVSPKSTESGNVAGLFLDTKLTFWKHIYTDLYLDFYNGQVKYDGVKTIKDAILGDIYYFPYSASFQHVFINGSFKPGFIFTINFAENRILQAIPYFGVGFRYWHRMSNVFDYEKYYHYKGVAGLKLSWLLTDNFVLSPYVEGGKIFNARMKCPYYGLSWSLGNKPVYEAGLELNYRLFEKLFLNGSISHSQFKYGRSENKKSKVSGEWHCEPDSKTKELKFIFGVRYGW